jgi:hypothetical protein
VRSFNELLDEYSLHIIMIRKGRVIDMAPEFISFKRIYQFKWNAISRLLRQAQLYFD